ncbi:MAG: 50S ribosomal protein L18e, partial [Haloarculaceae archaeon]
SGVLQKDVTVAAVDFSGTAEKKIDQAGETKTLEQAVENNPEGTNVRVIR